MNVTDLNKDTQVAIRMPPWNVQVRMYSNVDSLKIYIYYNQCTEKMILPPARRLIGCRNCPGDNMTNHCIPMTSELSSDNEVVCDVKPCAHC